MTISSFSCPCGNYDPTQAMSSKGLLGYEVLVCKRCATYSDHTNAYPADNWSMELTGLTKSDILLWHAQRSFSQLFNYNELDPKLLMKDLLEAFDTYEWEPREALSDIELQRWHALYHKADDQEIETQELSEFLELTDESCKSHVIFYRFKAEQVLRSIQEHLS